MPRGITNEILEIWAAHEASRHGAEDGLPIFSSYKDIVRCIDAIQEGDAPYEAYTVRYNGLVDADSPSWKCLPHVFYARDSKLVADLQLGNPAFNGKLNYQPYRQYNKNGQRMYSNVMSADYVWQQAVRRTTPTNFKLTN